MYKGTIRQENCVKRGGIFIAREFRVKSNMGVYHIRDIGCNHQQLFFCREDYWKFWYILLDKKVETEVKIIAYCLMGNHVHLMIGGELEQIAKFQQLVKGRYAQWHNDKYQRSGPVFDSRYRSKGVQDRAQFYALLRYIHLNPLAAGLVKSVDEYEFSSYNCYMGRQDDLVDPEVVLAEMDETDFIALHQKVMDNREFDIPTRPPHLVDEEAIAIILDVAGVDYPTRVQQLDVKFRNLVIAELRRRGLAIRQIGRLTGLSKYQIECARQGTDPM